MPRFLSPEWVEAFDGALEGLTVPGPTEEAGLGALGGQFTVVQEIHGGPDGEVTMVLVVADGRLHLSLASLAADREAASDRADVAISLSYPDAASLSRGELVAAEALGAGRIRVRGDLSVLVASQQMLASAQQYVGALAAETTY